MPHPDEGTIHAWLDGALPPDESSAVESHVSECPECSAAVAEARGLIAASSRILSALDAVPGGVIPVTGEMSGSAAAPSPRAAMRWGRGRQWGGYMARAAAVLLLAVGVRAAFRSEREPTLTAGADGASVPASGAASASERAMPAPPEFGGPPASAPARAAEPPKALSRDERVATRARASAGGMASAGAAGSEVGGVHGAPARTASVGARPAARQDAGVAANARAGAVSDLTMKSARVVEPRPVEEAAERKSATAPESPPLRLVQGWTVVATSVEATPDGPARRTTYDVRPGVRVELEERIAVPTATDAVAQAAAPQDVAVAPRSGRMRETSASSGTATATAPTAALGSTALERASVPSIRWTSAGGTELVLRGALSIAELRALRARIP